jgi:hypothetical protein
MPSEITTKKMSLGLFVFLIAISVPFDLIGMLPFLGFVVAILFMFFVKIQLHMHGYERGIIRSIAIFVMIAFLELVFSPMPSAIVYSASSFALNHWDTHKEQKKEERAT